MRRLSQLFVIALLLFMVLFLALLLVNATHAAEPAITGGNGISPWIKGPPSLTVTSASQARFVLTPEGQITFFNAAGKELAVLHPDGTVKLYGKPEESARVFWAAMARYRPDCEAQHALTGPSAYNAAHGHTDTHRRDRPSPRESPSGTRVHPQAPPPADSGTDGIF